MKIGQESIRGDWAGVDPWRLGRSRSVEIGQESIRGDWAGVDPWRLGRSRSVETGQEPHLTNYYTKTTSNITIYNIWREALHAHAHS